MTLAAWGDAEVWAGALVQAVEEQVRSSTACWLLLPDPSQCEGQAVAAAAG